MTQIHGPGGASAGGGGGGGLAFKPDVGPFTGATIAACRTARDNYFSAGANAATLAEFQRNHFLAIELDPTGANNSEFQVYAQGQEGNAYDAAQWQDRTGFVKGERGNAGSDATVNADNVDPLVGAYNGQIPGLVIPDGQLPASIMRDSELTQAAILNLLSLTAGQLDDLFVGAVVSGSGVGRSIVVTQADGSTVALPVPDTTGGGGGTGGSGNPVSGVAFSSDGMTLTLTLTDGSTVQTTVPAALRQAGLNQAAVQALINAAEADDLYAADVASQIASALTGYRPLAS